MNKIGILQGRLSQPINGFIQDFPSDTWEHEFELLDLLGLNHIEWVVNKKSFDAGHLNVDCKKYAEKILSISCDNLTNKNIAEKDFLKEQLEPICEFAVKNDIGSITIPLLEDSKIDSCADKFIKNIVFYANKYKNIDFNFELESDYKFALKLLKSHDNFYLTYDIGNITACKFNHNIYIRNCFDYINIVHLKDKSISPIKNVEPGTGAAKFNEIFKVLKELDYGGVFTLQTNRGPEGSEIDTVKRHKKFFEDLYAK